MDRRKIEDVTVNAAKIQVLEAVATHRGQTWAQFGRRWIQIVGCALLVTAGSAWMFPQSFIYFGVLHGMAVMLVLVRLTAGWGNWLWPLGLLATAWACPPIKSL